MTINRNYEMEEKNNPFIPYEEKFNFDYFCNDFKPQSQDIYRLSIYYDKSPSWLKEIFVSELTKWNNTSGWAKFLAVVGIADINYAKKETYLELNFNMYGKGRSYDPSIVYEFLSVLSWTLNYSLTQILSVDFQEEFYNKLNKEVIYFTNIAELHQYRKNKFIHHICFNVMNTYSLEAIIYEKLRLHNRAYPDDILQLTGVIKQDNEGYPILIAHTFLQKGDMIQLVLRNKKLWDSMSDIIIYADIFTKEAPTDFIGNEIIAGGMPVKNVEVMLHEITI